jgi:hypothetical protein
MKLGTITVEDLRERLPSAPDGPFGPFPARLLSDIRYLVVHHAAGPAQQTVAEVAALHTRWRKRANGSAEPPWAGIGYHFWITSDGHIQYVGDLATARANVAGRNREVVGFCLAGDFTAAPPPEPQLQALAQALHGVRQVLGGDVPVVAHGELASTACPGATWPAWRGLLQEMMRELARTVGLLLPTSYEEELARLRAQIAERDAIIGEVYGQLQQASRGLISRDGIIGDLVRKLEACHAR